MLNSWFLIGHQTDISKSGLTWYTLIRLKKASNDTKFFCIKRRDN